jgi:tripartite-type tricarboxylate transporter receptor subunit TctC
MPGAFFRIVHLDGGAVQLKEGLAGNIVAAFDNVGGAMKSIKAGQVRALVVTDTERSKFLPDVPTSVELGFPTVISSSARGIVAPKGTPPAALKKLTEVLEQAMKDPEHGRKLDEQGLGVKVLVGDAYASFYREAHEKAKKYTAWAKQRPQK